MNKHLHRTFTLFALTAALAVSLVAHANPLPAPHVPSGGPVPVVPLISPIAPASGAPVTYANKLVWSNEVTPSKYTLKFRVEATGQTVKVNVPLGHCVEDGNCTISLGETLLFDSVADGGTVSWRVIGKFGAGKSKSAKRTFIADTVNTPDSLLPVHGSTMQPANDLTWHHSIANASYTLIVTHIATGEQVIKQKVLAVACAATCAVDAFALTGFIENHGYSWFVKAKGYNGDKAKSSKQTFYPQYIAEAR